jgi:hypothetical protein
MARYSRKAPMRTKILGGGVMLLSLALGGCDCDHGRCGGPVAAATITTADVSRTAPVVVFISPSFSGSAAFIGGLPPIFDLRIAASTTVDLDRVTIHMIDGTNLGGPMVTVPRTDLVGQFGSTRIVAGTTRTFTLRRRFVCTNPPRSVAAEITVRDSRGVSFGVTTESPGPWLHWCN